jgi:cytoskeletal protein RodZ
MPSGGAFVPINLGRTGASRADAQQTAAIFKASLASVPTSAEESTGTVSLTTTAADSRHGGEPSHGYQPSQSQLLQLKTILSPLATDSGVVSAKDPQRAEKSATPVSSTVAGLTDRRPENVRTKAESAAEFAVRKTEEEEAVAAGGRLADLSAFLATPHQINESVNKYFML